MNKLIAVLTLFVSMNTLKANDFPMLNDSILRTGYAKKLKKVVNTLEKGQKARLSAIEYTIPQNNAEFHIFYSYTSKTQPIQKAFNELNRLFEKNAQSRQLDFFVHYLNFAAYVDGEFAESYFDSAMRIIEKNQTYYAQIKGKLNQKARNRIATHFNINH